MGKAMQSGQMLNVNKKLFETYGRTFQYNPWGTNVISTKEPRNIQTVLTLAFDNLGVEPVKQKESGGSLMAKGIFTADGAIWARSRALMRPTFARPQISNFESLEMHVKQLLDCIPRDGTVTDLQPLFKRMVGIETLLHPSIQSIDYDDMNPVPRYLYRIPLWRVCQLPITRNLVQINAISEKLRYLHAWACGPDTTWETCIHKGT